MAKPETVAPVHAHPALIPLPARIEWRAGALPAAMASPEAVRWVHAVGLPAEGYVIEIAATGAVVRSSSAAGAFYAEQTLNQLRAANGSLPGVLIQDAPRFAWRGLMLDYSYDQVSSARVFAFDPVAGLPPEAAAHVLGLQANFWSHIDREPERVDWQLFPRLLAIAERGWSPQNSDSWENFHARLQLQRSRLAGLGVNFNSSGQ